MQPWERDVTRSRRAGGGCCGSSHSAPPTTASTARPSSRSTSTLIRRSHELIEARDYALAVVQTVREPLVVLDADCRVGLANEAFYALFGDTAEQIEGQPLWDIGRGVWDDADLRYGAR